MTTQQDAFDERLTRLEAEVGDIKTLLGENALLQSQILNLLQQQVQRLDGIDQRLDRVDQRLDGMDQRLDRVEQRLDGMDRRLDGIDQRLDRADRRTEDIARHLGLPPPNGTG